MTLLAEETSDAVAGTLGLVVTLLLVVATVLLVRSMNKRLKRLPPSFPDQADDDEPRRPDGTG